MVKQIESNPLPNYIAMVSILLMAVGTVFVFSAGVNLSQELDLQRFYDFPSLRQILFFPLAVLIMYTVSCFDYRRFSFKSWFKSPTMYLLVLSLALLTLVLIPGIGVEKNYARRWLEIPAGQMKISFQPSELAKWSILIFLAAYCDKFSDSLKLFWKRFVPICMIVGLVVLLIILEDFGTAALIALLAFLILLVAGVKWWHILAPVPIGLIGFAAAIMSSESRRERIAAFLQPEKWADSANYQANQSLLALGSGGLWGKGLGMGICKYGHLPEDTTDFIFAIIGEEMGFIGAAAVILLFIAFVWLGILVVVRCKDRFGQLLAGTVVLAITIQAALNIGVVTVVLPTKGIPLPFVSAGGTSMLMSAFAVGILINIARHSTKESLEDSP
ncbi:MAG: putative peptidoglycan glycosyltransferase FtsW [Planctomycetota bacterium]|nr:putative peptidoglycan glycosyltransferase FtsW [Planctomycetota bacterium]